MNKTVIIQASSRSDGDTSRIVNYLASKNPFEVIDLNTKTIGHYDYKNEGNNFLSTITNILNTYETIIFATPVYWYSMSGLLKVFFDRLSDLLLVHKDLGRTLRGKNMVMISTSNDGYLVEGFNRPFVQSAKYLGMHYLGDIHTYVEDNVITENIMKRIDDFSKHIKEVL
jgi:multimeric flavodoxin WrbA